VTRTTFQTLPERLENDLAALCRTLNQFLQLLRRKGGDAARRFGLERGESGNAEQDIDFTKEVASLVVGDMNLSALDFFCEFKGAPEYDVEGETFPLTGQPCPGAQT